MSVGFGFRHPMYRALGSLTALASAAWLVACSSDRSISTDNLPAAAATTTPSTVVTPAEPFRPWEEDQQTTADSSAPTPVATSSVAVTPTPITTVPAEEVAPVEEAATQEELCDVDDITRDLGEASDITEMIVSYCDGRWAHAALYATDIQSWAVRGDDQWEWLPADGEVSALGKSQGCYLPETIEAFEPVPAAARVDLPVCGPGDRLHRAS